MIAEVRDLVVGPASGGAPVVNGVTLSLDAGRVLGLVGRSGCGKTTVAHALFGHLRPGLRVRSGSVRVAGVDPFASPWELRGRVVSYLGQDPAAALNPARRIGSQLGEAVRLRGGGDVAALLESVGLPSDRAFLRRFSHQISGGQAQRVGLAMALAGSPRLLVLDEPTSALDTRTAAEIRALLAGLLGANGPAAVLVSHDPHLIAQLADEIFTMPASHPATPSHPSPDQPKPTYPHPPSYPQPHPITRSASFSTAKMPHEPTPHPIVGGGYPRVVLYPGDGGFAGDGGHAGDGGRAAGGGFARDGGRAGDGGRAAGGGFAGDGGRGGDGRWRSGSAVSVLAVESLLVCHGRRAVVEDVSLRIGVGGALALVGPSGSGKTTVARAIVGLHRRDAGRIVLDGQALAPHFRERSREQRRAIQLVAQDSVGALNPRESVRDSLLRALSTRDGRRRVVTLLDRVHLPASCAERLPGELSGGERQRVNLCRALAAKPRLLVCDEVTSALDRETADAVLDLLDELRAGLGLAVLLITHDPAVAARAQHVVALDQGRVPSRDRLAA